MLRVLFKLLFNILVDHFVFEYVIQISMAKVILSGSLIRIVCTTGNKPSIDKNARQSGFVDAKGRCTV